MNSASIEIVSSAQKIKDLKSEPISILTNETDFQTPGTLIAEVCRKLNCSLIEISRNS